MTEIAIAIVIFTSLGAVSVFGYLSASRSSDRIERRNRPAYMSGHGAGAASGIAGLRAPTERLQD